MTYEARVFAKKVELIALYGCGELVSLRLERQIDGGKSRSRQYEEMNAGELPTALRGRHRYVPLDFIARRLLEIADGLAERRAPVVAAPASVTPIRPGRGRPPGSRNKPKIITGSTATA